MVKRHLGNGDIGGKRSLLLNPQSYEPEDKKEQGHPKYQSLVGGLLFIARMTRPDIAMHVNLLRRRMSDHTPENCQVAKQVLWYLYCTKFDGLRSRRDKDLRIRIYANASCRGEEALLQTGVLMTVRNQIVGWYSRRQDIVSLSVTEAEYIADCEGAKDAIWMSQFLMEIGASERTLTLMTDSEGAYNLSKTLKFMRRSRHIEHRFHYL